MVLVILFLVITTPTRIIYIINIQTPSILFLQPADVFKSYYKDVGTKNGTALLRFNYYPRITDIEHIKAGQIRCGEHTDYGGITLLFQDDAGGLEVTSVHKFGSHFKSDRN